MRRRWPRNYRIFVVGDGVMGYVTIEDGYCTAADAALAPWLGCSAAWIYGRIRFEGWVGSARALPEPQGSLL